MLRGIHGTDLHFEYQRDPLLVMSISYFYPNPGTLVFTLKYITGKWEVIHPFIWHDVDIVPSPSPLYGVY